MSCCSDLKYLFILAACYQYPGVANAKAVTGNSLMFTRHYTQQPDDQLVGFYILFSSSSLILACLQWPPEAMACLSLTPEQIPLPILRNNSTTVRPKECLILSPGRTTPTTIQTTASTLSTPVQPVWQALQATATRIVCIEYSVMTSTADNTPYRRTRRRRLRSPVCSLSRLTFKYPQHFSLRRPRLWKQ